MQCKHFHNLQIHISLLHRHLIEFESLNLKPICKTWSIGILWLRLLSALLAAFARPPPPHISSLPQSLALRNSYIEKSPTMQKASLPRLTFLETVITGKHLKKPAFGPKKMPPTVSWKKSQIEQYNKFLMCNHVSTLPTKQ